MKNWRLDPDGIQIDQKLPLGRPVCQIAAHSWQTGRLVIQAWLEKTSDFGLIWRYIIGMMCLGLWLTVVTQAQISKIEPIFDLPFAAPPGLETWFLDQPYGNTTGAYRQRFSTYRASGGIHFGLDLVAPCGTEILAIADGVVFALDGPFGSPPHNLMIDHPDLGYASMYGHLLERPPLRPGQAVKRGQVIALTGDSLGTCDRRPHLHLEIRDLGHVRKYNPLPFFEVNWDNLALIGPFNRQFQRDLANPRQWQSLYDQPSVYTGGLIVNDFETTWPLDWNKVQ